MENKENLSEVEQIKLKSNLLRGTIIESLANDLTGALYSDDTQLIKFHGSYQQTDRDMDAERKKQKLEALYSFMIRVRMPGGIVTSKQWLAIDELSSKYGNETMKLTTRQAFQLHGILKKNIKSTLQEINKSLLDTIAACGDVNRNVMCSPNPFFSDIHKQANELAKKIGDHLLPSSRAYHQIWLDQELVAGEIEEEPLYSKSYLPRKFKIAIAIQPYNDTDIFANDIGLIAISENNKLIGYNLAIGGGMGQTFGMPQTYARLASLIGFVTPEKVVNVAEKIMLIQRDNGNRTDRKLARLKYTIDNMGLDAFCKELTNRLGYSLDPVKEYHFINNNDRIGWHKGTDNKWHLWLYIEGGRILDKAEKKLRTGLREIAKIHDGLFVLTGNQNLIIANILNDNKEKIDELLKKYQVKIEKINNSLHINSLACVALNTCSLAFSEAERYLPSLIDKLELIAKEKGINDTPMNIRMTGCPNGCARPFLGEIGLVGKSIGYYNLYLGASRNGTRLNKLYKETLNELQILSEFNLLFERFAKERTKDESFGDFVLRVGIV